MVPMCIVNRSEICFCMQQTCHQGKESHWLQVAWFLTREGPLCHHNGTGANKKKEKTIDLVIFFSNECIFGAEDPLIWWFPITVIFLDPFHSFLFAFMYCRSIFQNTPSRPGAQLLKHQGGRGAPILGGQGPWPLDPPKSLFFFLGGGR